MAATESHAVYLGSALAQQFGEKGDPATVGAEGWGLGVQFPFALSQSVKPRAVGSDRPDVEVSMPGSIAAKRDPATIRREGRLGVVAAMGQPASSACLPVEQPDVGSVWIGGALERDQARRSWERGRRESNVHEPE